MHWSGCLYKLSTRSTGERRDYTMNLTHKIITEPKLYEDIQTLKWLTLAKIPETWSNEGLEKVTKVGKWKSESWALKLFQRKICSVGDWLDSG